MLFSIEKSWLLMTLSAFAIVLGELKCLYNGLRILEDRILIFSSLPKHSLSDITDLTSENKGSRLLQCLSTFSYPNTNEIIKTQMRL